MRPLLILVISLVCAGAAEPLALVGATAIDPASGTITPAATILIDDGRIIAVGGAIVVPPGATVVHLDGAWVVPGYIDAHVHFFQSGGLYTRPDAIDLSRERPYPDEVARITREIDATLHRYLRCGITAVADVGGPMSNFAVRDRAEAMVDAPHVAVAGPLLSSWQPPGLDVADRPIIRVDSIEAALAEVGRQAERKPDFIKIWYIVGRGQTTADFFPIAKAICTESHRLGIRVCVHATELATAKAALHAGADVLVHSVDDRPLDDDFLRAARDRDAAYCTTAIVHGAYPAVFAGTFRATREEAAWADPYRLGELLDLEHLPPASLPTWLVGFRAGPAPVDRSGPIAADNAALADRAGIDVAVGTDAGNIGTLPGPAIFREFAMLRAAGSEPMTILRWATIGGARLMRREDLGRLAPGQRADLVVLDADPLVDIANASRIRSVIKGGAIFDPATLVPDDAAALAQRALNALNARDGDALAALMSVDATLRTADTTLAGSAAIRAWCVAMAKSHRVLKGRDATGDTVIDRYEVVAPPQAVRRESITYRIAAGRIVEATISAEIDPRP